MFKIGTTIVNGSENDESIEVTVEIYIELHAPPEQIVKGIESEEKTFNKTSLNSEFDLGFSGSMKLRKAYTKPAIISKPKHFRCLTSHL